MRRRKFPIVIATLTVVALIPTMLSSAWGVEYKAIYKFKGGLDGWYPYAALIFDAAGNLYGTTERGGAYGAGTVFKLSPNPGGTWTHSVLFSLGLGGTGAKPYANLIFDPAGNLYGTTSSGGLYGWGTVFRLTPNPDGSWKGSALYSFAGGTDGSSPLAGLILDRTGSLYGTTCGIFNDDHGTVFKLTANPDGSWTKSLLWSFSWSDGAFPRAGLIFDAAGNLYGTTSGGGAYGDGTVFTLVHRPDGSWIQQVISSQGSNAALPFSGLVSDAAGNLYGTTAFGGYLGCYAPNGCGTVFELTPNPDGTWTYKNLYSFNRVNGREPIAGLAMDASGILYGTTQYGGVYDAGTVFKLAPQPDGSWKLTRLHSFKNHYPYAGLVLDAAGNLYGTTVSGGKGYGVVFEITP